MDHCGAVDRPREQLSATWARQVVDAMPIPMFVIDAEHRVVHWNRACEELTGA